MIADEDTPAPAVPEADFAETPATSSPVTADEETEEVVVVKKKKAAAPKAVEPAPAPVVPVPAAPAPSGPFPVTPGTLESFKGIDPTPQFVNLATEAKERVEIVQPSDIAGRESIKLTVEKF